MEWTFDRAPDWSWRVWVKAWHSGTEWKYNVYADLHPSHPLHSFTRDGIRYMPFHGGVSSDTFIEWSPPKPAYDWEKVYKIRRVGSDYGHDGDWYGEDDPKDGIPTRVYLDACELVKFLREYLQE